LYVAGNQAKKKPDFVEIRNAAAPASLPPLERSSSKMHATLNEIEAGKTNGAEVGKFPTNQLPYQVPSASQGSWPRNRVAISRETNRAVGD
jgi:hypothetical protein